MTEENQYMPQTLRPAGVSPSDFPSPAWLTPPSFLALSLYLEPHRTPGPRPLHRGLPLG